MASGTNTTLVPLRRELSPTGDSSLNVPYSKAARLDCFSLFDSTIKLEESAFTALVPTPFNPTDFLNALESYFPPVFIFETTSTTLPSGIPRPKSRTVTVLSLMEISMVFPAPITNSSTQLSKTSFKRI